MHLDGYAPRDTTKDAIAPPTPSMNSAKWSHTAGSTDNIYVPASPTTFPSAVHKFSVSEASTTHHEPTITTPGSNSGNHFFDGSAAALPFPNRELSMPNIPKSGNDIKDYTDSSLLPFTSAATAHNFYSTPESSPSPDDMDIVPESPPMEYMDIAPAEIMPPESPRTENTGIVPMEATDMEPTTEVVSKAAYRRADDRCGLVRLKQTWINAN